MSRPKVANFVLAPSLARTTDLTTAAQTNDHWLGVRLYLDITAVSGTSPTLDVKVQVQDPASTDWVDLAGAAFTQKTGIVKDELTIHPSVVAAANEKVADVVGNQWRVVGTIGGTDTPTFTYSIGATLLG